MIYQRLRFLALVAFALLLSACAVSPVKPLYPAESARLRTVEVRVSAPRDALSVEELTTQTMVNPVGPGAYTGAGILGAAIGAAIADSIIAAQAKKNAETLRLQLAGLVDQVRGVDYYSLVVRNLQTGLGGGRVRITAVRETPPAPPSGQAEIARAANADATLFVNIQHTFLNSASGSADGGINTSFQAKVALVGKDGKELLKDSIVFVAPRSADAGNDARVTWWRDQARYRSLLERSGYAFTAGINELMVQARYASDGDFNAARSQKDNAERTKAAVARFHTCDSFQRIAAPDTRFETYRSEPTGALRVGIVCGAALATGRRPAPAQTEAVPPGAGTPAAPAAANAPGTLSELSGRWSGTFTCGPYLAQGGQVASRGGWTVPVVMTMAGSQATVVRGDASYRETLSGTVDGSLALALEGQGAMTRTSQSPWTTRLSGLITVEGGQTRYRASGGIDDARGVHVRDCSAVLARGAMP